MMQLLGLGQHATLNWTVGIMSPSSAQTMLGGKKIKAFGVTSLF